ncbi:MAG: polyphosphate polymerase domain-containing protein [Planctomycetota bacterium]
MSPPWRRELKYWSTPAQEAALLAELGPLLARDRRTSAASPSYTVTSLYLDTAGLDGFYEREEGVGRRAKLRLRRYGAERGGFAELKERRGSRVRKWRVPLGGEELERLARGDLEPLDAARAAGSQEAARVLLELARRPLEPAVITRYEREAWEHELDPGLRVTFDRALCGAGEDLVDAFLSPQVASLELTPLHGETPTILEVKTTRPLPPSLCAALRRGGPRWTRISKFCLAVAATRPLGAASRGR